MSLRLLILRGNQPLVARFPGVYYRAAWVMGWALFHGHTAMRRNAIRNILPLVEGDRAEAKRAALRALQNVSRYYVDLATVPSRDMAKFEVEHLELQDGDRLAALAEAGPVVAVSAHTGNAELAIQALTFRGRPFVALVEAQHPPAWSRYLIKLRSAAGGTFHETTFTGIRAALAALHEGGLVGFMGDRDLQGNGLCATLAGRLVRLPTGPWQVARRTNALVFPIFTTRTSRDRFMVWVEQPFRVGRDGTEEADIAEAVRHFAGLLETHLRRDPSQWAITENFWQVHACG